MYSPNLNSLMNMLEANEENDLPFPLFPSKEKIEQRRKRLLLLSDHCHGNTSNSKVAWNLLRILSLKLDTYHFGISTSNKINSECRPYPKNVDCCNKNEEGGFKALSNYIDFCKPDFIIIFNNLDIANHYLNFLNTKQIESKIILYINMMYYNLTPNNITMLNSSKVDQIFVTSEYWKGIFNYYKVIKPVGILHYGLESLPIIKKEKARELIKMSNSVFTILVPCENLQQYRYDLIIKAYVKLLKKYPSKDMRLFCLCSKENSDGYSILEIYRQELCLNDLDVTFNLNKILLTHDHMLNDFDLRNIYHCADISVCIAENEGLNLASFEMSAICLPQIVPKSGQFENYCNSNNSILLDITNRYYLSRKIRTELSEVRAVSSDDLFSAMEKYLLDQDLCKKHSEYTDNNKKFTWPTVTEELMKYLLA